MNSGLLKYLSFCALALLPWTHGYAQDDESIRSAHFGLFYSNGVDIAGYTVEKRINADVYSFYTFGFPALAALGLSYYRSYEGDGFTSSIGVGIGSVLYGSMAYQWQTDKLHYLKLGAGLTVGVAYGGVYPVLSYEYRFER